MSEPGFVLVSGDFVKTGGMDRANFALADYLATRGRDLHLVAYRVDPGLLGRPGVSFHQVAKPLNAYLLAEPMLRRAGRRLAGRLSGQGARVVVNGGCCDWGDINWVHYVHAAWAPRPGRGLLRRVKGAISHRLMLDAERASLRRARVIVANSDQTRGVLIDRLGLSPERVHTVYYGVDPERFRPATDAERAETRARLGWPADRPTLAFVGALGDLRKGLDTLLSAWRRVCADPGWDARLIVIGAGASLGQLKDEARDLGDSIEFLGFRRDVPDLLRGSDALVSPTRYEAYGLNVHEALCCGLPALVSRSAGVAERYPAELADLLIPDPDDAVDLADRLRLWRDGRGRFEAATVALADQLRSYTWDDMASRFLEIVGESPVVAGR